MSASAIAGPWNSDPVAGATPPGATLPAGSAVAASGGADLPVPQTSTAVDTTAPWQNDPVAPSPDQPTSWARAAGLDVRSLASGAAGLAGTAANAPRNIANDVVQAGEDVVSGHPGALIPTWLGGSAPTTQPTPVANTAPRLPEPDIATATNGPSLDDIIHPERWQMAAHFFANKLGLPQPRTPGERVSSAAVSALPALALAPEAEAAEVPEAATAIGRGMQAMREAIPTRVAASVPVMGSGAVSQEVGEQGGTPGEQVAAGLAVGGIPAIAEGGAGLARIATRGPGAARAAAMTQRLTDASANDVPLTVGQATGSPLAKAGEAVSRSMWGGGRLNQIAEAQNVALGDRVNTIVDGLSGGGDVSPTGAGAAINRGVANAKSSMRTAERAAYSAVDEAVPPTTAIDVSGTLGVLDKLAAPVPGAEATSAALTPKLITSIRNSMQSDAKDGVMPYAALAALRTQVGHSIDWGFAPADPVANGALKQVYGALTQDLNKGAAAVSPEAAQAVTDARNLYSTNQDQRDVLDTVVEKAGGPEAVYRAALSGTNIGATKIRTIMTALDPDRQNLVRATVLDQMGRAVPSEQTAEGAEFNASTFLTRWARLSPEAKDALFGAQGAPGTLRASLDSLTNTLSTLRKGGALKNPSGTGPLLSHVLGAGNAVSDIMISLWTGHPAIALGSIGVPLANRILAGALTNPRLVRWLAATSKMPPSALPVAINQLVRMGTPGAQQLAALMSAAVANTPGASSGQTAGANPAWTNMTPAHQRAALAMLEAKPELAADFKAKYGFLPK